MHMQKREGWKRSFEWELRTVGLQWTDLVLFALGSAPSQRATIDELYDVLGRHLRAQAEADWKDRVRAELETETYMYVLGKDGHWKFHPNCDGPASWRSVVESVQSKWKDLSPFMRLVFERAWKQGDAK